MNFLGSDDFLARFMSARLVYLAGRVGSGKTSASVALSWLLHREGLVDATICNFPLAWASPIKDAPLRRFAILLDELGVFYDARQVVGKGGGASNDFRKTLLGFPRKIDAYVIVSSRVVPDKSFRALTVQRDYALPFGFNRYVYGEDDGALTAEGNFWCHGLSDVWPFYDHRYIPSGVEYLAAHVARAVENSRGGEADPNEVYEPGEVLSERDKSELYELFGRPVAAVESEPAPVAEIQTVAVTSGGSLDALPVGRQQALASKLRGVRVKAGGNGVGRLDCD